MPITTLDGALAGMRAPRPFGKVGNTAPAVGALRAYTPFYVAGFPGAAVAPSSGINGAAVTAPLAGALFRENPSGVNAYMSKFMVSSSIAGTFWLIDRLWANSGLSVTSTTAQAITPAALPARSADGTVNGDGVFAAVEWSATGGAGTPTVTLTYTDEIGTTGQTSSFTGLASPPTGTFELFPLAAGDTGIRAPTSFIQNATRTSGTMHLVLFRFIAALPVPLANVGFNFDVLTGGMPRIYDNSALQLLHFPTATTAATITGEYTETHG